MPSIASSETEPALPRSMRVRHSTLTPASSATSSRRTPGTRRRSPYTLSNGLEIPKLGLGTWFIDDDAAAQAVRDATAIGYRHIDTAQAYGNEAGVGEGIRTCGVPREEMFVTTKLAAKYDVSVPQLSIRYVLQLGLLPLPKTANPDHMRTNADVDFEISADDMDVLQNVEPIEDYGEASVFPVYGGR